MYFFNYKPKLNLMKMTRISNEFSSSLLDSVLRGFGSKILMALIVIVSMVGSAQAQSINDWVGNRNLVNGTTAITRLKEAARVIVDQGQNSSQSSTAVANGQGADFSFILRVGEEIKLNSRDSKEAINLVAQEMASEGVSTQEVTRIVQAIVAILS
jgi:hypothetical protein